MSIRPFGPPARCFGVVGEWHLDFRKFLRGFRFDRFSELPETSVAKMSTPRQPLRALDSQSGVDGRTFGGSPGRRAGILRKHFVCIDLRKSKCHSSTTLKRATERRNSADRTASRELLIHRDESAGWVCFSGWCGRTACAKSQHSAPAPTAASKRGGGRRTASVRGRAEVARACAN